MKKIFISGKITGEPILECMDKFYIAHVYIRRNIAMAYHPTMEGNYDRIITPLHLEGIHFGISHKEAMKICLAELKKCTHIYMLKDWKESKGAKEEHQFAIDNGIEIIYE